MIDFLGLRTQGGGEVFLDIKETGNAAGITDDWYELFLQVRNNHVDLSLAGEIITTSEIKIIIDNLKKTLNNEITETIYMETIEPFLKFEFNKEKLIIKIFFQYTEDYYCLHLDKYNIKKLYEYLSNLDFIKNNNI